MFRVGDRVRSVKTGRVGYISYIYWVAADPEPYRVTWDDELTFDHKYYGEKELEDLGYVDKRAFGRDHGCQHLRTKIVPLIVSKFLVCCDCGKDLGNVD